MLNLEGWSLDFLFSVNKGERLRSDNRANIMTNNIYFDDCEYSGSKEN